jgi:hypothetical protein
MDYELIVYADTLEEDQRSAHRVLCEDFRAASRANDYPSMKLISDAELPIRLALYGVAS